MINIKVEDSVTCSSCGGHCCRWSPGIFEPSQLIKEGQDPKEAIRALLKTGDYVIDRKDYMTDPEAIICDLGSVLVVQPKTEHAAKSSWTASRDNFGRCNFHTDAGCTLSYEGRPLECQMLVPHPQQKCHYSESWNVDVSIKIPWLKYQKELQALDDEYWDTVPVTPYTPPQSPK